MSMLIYRNGMLCVLGGYEEKEKIKSIGAAWDKTSRLWVMPFTIVNYEMCLQRLNNPQIESSIQEELERQRLKESKLRSIAAMSKRDQPIQLKIPGIKLALFNYQKFGVLYAIANEEGFLLADQMGLGKCVTKKTRISAEDGWLPIEDLFSKYAIMKSVVKDSDGGEWFDVSPVSVCGIVSDKLEFQSVKKFFREKVDIAVEIELQDGSVQRVGANHKYLTPDGWKRSSELKKGNWVAVANRVEIPNPRLADHELVELLAWQIGEGYEDANTSRISITQNDVSILERMKKIVDSLGLCKSFGKRTPIKTTITIGKDERSSHLDFASVEYVSFLEELGYEFGHRSGDKRIPDFIRDASTEAAKVFLRAYFDAEGCCNKDNLELTSKSRDIIETIHYMLRRFGVLGVISNKLAETQKGMETYWRITIGGIYARIFKEEIGFGYKHKKDILEKLCEKFCNTNVGYSIPCHDLLCEFVSITGLSHDVIGFGHAYASGIQNPSRTLALSIAERMMNIVNNGIESIVGRWATRREKSIAAINANKDRLNAIAEKIHCLASAEVIWLKTERADIIPYNDYVYDLVIEGEPNYIFDMVVGHNTLTAIGVACHKKYKDGITNCLIIVPASLKWNWPIEIEKFTSEPYVVIDGAPDERVRQWLGKLETRSIGHGKYEYREVGKSGKTPFFYIVNYELILEDLFGGRDQTIKQDDSKETIARKLKISGKAQVRAERLRDVRTRVWNQLVIDEAQAIKNHTAKKTRNVKVLKGQFRMALTGTPLDGKLEELHSIMEFVKPGLFAPKTRFLQRHAEFDYFGKITKYKRIDEVKQKLAPYYLRRLKEDVLKDLPPKTYSNRIITMTTEEMKTYDEIADREHPLTEDSEAMVKVIRCKQFCDHPELVGLPIKSSKMDDFLDVVDELVCQSGQKVIVFTQYKMMLDIIERELKDKLKLKMLRIDGDTPKTDRAAMQKTFNEDPHIDAIIGTGAMSAGLNLTGASYVILYDQWWSNSMVDQAVDRAHRIGQKNAVTVIEFTCQNTIEERIIDVLKSKTGVTSDVLGDDAAGDEMIIKKLGVREIQDLL